MRVLQLQHKLHLLFSGVGLHQDHGLLEQRHHVGRFEFILFAALFDAGEVEHVFDERRQPPAFLDDEPEIFPLFLRFRDFVARQVFRHEPHRRDGCAQFVRDAGNEIGFHFVEFPLLPERPPGGQQPDQCGRGRDGHERAEPERAGALPLVELVRAGEINIHFQELFRLNRGCQDVGGRRVQWRFDFPATGLAAAAIIKGPQVEIRCELTDFLSSHFDADAEIIGKVFFAGRQVLDAEAQIGFAVADQPLSGRRFIKTDGQPGLLRARRRQDGIGGSVNNQHRRFEPKQI